MIPVFGILLFLLGSFLIVIATRDHIEALEQIDSGIHEVINGESEYEFKYEYKDERLSSMAQSLNLMVAVLAGRDIYYDDDSDSSWMESFLEEGSEWGDADDSSGMESADPDDGQAPDHSDGLATVTSSAHGAVHETTTAEDQALALEPAESYYRRIYGEFTQGQQAPGEEAISYVRFVEKVVRQERVLRNQMSCRMVRFRVIQRDDGPALLPVKLD